MTHENTKTKKMTRQEFNKQLAEVVKQLRAQANNTQVEQKQIPMWCGTKIADVFNYAATSEKCLENNMANIGKERKTTFMADLSIAEWVGGKMAVVDTIKNCIISWIDNVEYIAEFVLCVNSKSWEHSRRGNDNWAALYADMYYAVLDLVYDYYEGDDENTRYLWGYLD